MRRNIRDDLRNLSFLLTISIFWETYLEPIRKSAMEICGEIIANYYYFRNKAPS